MSLRDDLIKAGIIKPAPVKAAPPESLVDELVELIQKVERQLSQPRPSKSKGKSKQAAAQPQPKKKKQYSPKPVVLADVVKRKSPPSPPLRCVLCGEIVKWGHMEEHKFVKHGEQLPKHSTPRESGPLPRAVFVRGGSPGLKN